MAVPVLMGLSARVDIFELGTRDCPVQASVWSARLWILAIQDAVHLMLLWVGSRRDAVEGVGAFAVDVGLVDAG